MASFFFVVVVRIGEVGRCKAIMLERLGLTTSDWCFAETTMGTAAAAAAASAKAQQGVVSLLLLLLTDGNDDDTAPASAKSIM